MSKKIVFLFLLVNSHLFCQTPNWAWAKSAGGIDSDNGSRIETDLNGNVFVSGFFQSATIDFGNTTLTNSSPGSNDYFLVKFDQDGNVIWAISAGGDLDDEIYGLSIDTGGNIIVTGRFNSSILPIGTTTLVNSGIYDIFTVKYDPDGNVLWAKKSGGSLKDEGLSASTDLNNNIIVTGFFSSSTITFGSSNLYTAGGADMFIVKYDPNGNVLWAKSEGGTGIDYGTCASTDNSGNIFVTGFFASSSILFGSTLVNNSNQSCTDVFLLKYDSNGNILWVKTAGGSNHEVGSSLETDNNGNVILVGYYISPTVAFGTTTLTNVGTASTNDGFVVKYNSNGQELWAKSIGGNNSDVIADITIDNIGNAYISGLFASSSLNTGNTSLLNAGAVSTYDVFVVKYDSLGNDIWALSEGDSSNESGNSLALNDVGDIFVTGRFQSSSINFGATTLTNSGNNTEEMFVGKLAFLSASLTLNVSSSNFSVQPNPTNGLVTISGLKPFGQNRIMLYTISGEKMDEFITPESEMELNLEMYATGMYFLRFQDQVIRIVKN